MQSCNEKLSDLHTLSLKDTVHRKEALVHTHDVKEMMHWSQLCQGEENTTQFFQRPMLKPHQYGIDGVGLAPSHTSCAKLQQRSPGSLGHPQLLPCSPSPAPSPPGAGWAALQQSVSPPVSPAAPLPHSHTILVFTLSATEWLPLPSSPDPVHVTLDVSRPLHWVRHLTVLHNSWLTQASQGHRSSALKEMPVSGHFWNSTSIVFLSTDWTAFFKTAPVALSFLHDKEQHPLQCLSYFSASISSFLSFT